MAPTEPETRRIVLLGKTGSGKSSLANTLFGEKNVFKVNDSANSGTMPCKSDTKNINERNIQLIDTPGLFNTDPESSDLSLEILRCITECAPGPHAFLLVMKIEKFTKQEQAVVDLILKYFSEEALKYTTVVFTRGDDLPEEMKIKEWVNENKALRNLVQKCGGRCHVFDNKYWNNSQDEYRNNQYQVQELLKTIDKTVRENRGGYYTNEMLQIVQKEKEEGSIIKSIWNYLNKNKKGAITGAILGAFLGSVVVAGAIYGVGAEGVAAVTVGGSATVTVEEGIMQATGEGLLVVVGVGPGVVVVAVVAGAAIGAVLGALAGAWVSENFDSETDLCEKLEKNETVQAVKGALNKFKSD